jgi:hypothetical protein
MGMNATIYALSGEAYEAGVAGQLDAFLPGEAGVSLGKAWHAIHYLITGDAELRFLTTGLPLAEAEPCELHSPEDIRKLSERLDGVETSDLMTMFDPEAFNRLKIYQTPFDTSFAQYLQPHLDAFLTALRAAARDGYGLFVVIA